MLSTQAELMAMEKTHSTVQHTEVLESSLINCLREKRMLLPVQRKAQRCCTTSPTDQS